VGFLGAAVALVTALAFPIGYGLIGYFKEAKTLAFKADLTAAKAAQYIYAPEAPWRYDTDQLAAISEIRSSTGAPIVQRIMDAKGAPIMRKGDALPWPTFARRAPIVASGAVVGAAEVSASLRPLLEEVALAGLAALLLAVAVYYAFAVLPLKVIDRSLESLEETNDKFRRQNLLLDAALENMAQGLAMFDDEERIVVANDRYAELYGMDPALARPGTTLREVVEQRIARGVYPGVTAEFVLEAMRERVACGQPSRLTNRLGDGRIVVSVVQPRPDGGWVVTQEDITEREGLNAQLAQQNTLLKQREEQLEAQNRRFNAAINNMSQGLCLFDADQRVVFANRRYAELYGLPAEQLRPGTTLAEIFAARIAKGVYAQGAARQMVDKGIASFSKQVSEIISLSDGRFISVLRRPMADGGLVSTHEDVTEREKLNARLAEQNDLLRQREEELEEQNERFDAALRNMPLGLCMYDAEQRVLIANDRYAEMYGLTPADTKPGTTLRQIVERRVARGVYAGDSPEAYVAARLAAFNTASSTVLDLNDGRAICVTRTPMRGGGWVTTHEDVTERERLKQRLEQQHEQLDVAMNNMAQGLAMFDAEQRLVVCNNLYAEMYGLTPEQVAPGTSARQILAYRMANGCYKPAETSGLLDRQIEKFGKIVSETQELADARVIEVKCRQAASGAVVITHEDVSERQRLNALLEQKNRLLSERTSRLQAIIDNFPGGILFLDGDLRVTVCNEKARTYLGLPETTFADRPPLLEEIFRFSAGRGEFGPGDPDQQVAERMALVKGRKPYISERERQDGTVLEIRGVPLGDGGFVATFMDITERRRSEAKIVHMALHDALTELPNRVLLNERLEQALARVKRGEVLAVHLLDLDHFKNVNDTLGHPAGDKLLNLVSDRLRALVRETDTIARMGGDEFAVLQVALAQPADATVLALRIIEAVSEPYYIDGHQVVIGTSVGIAVGPTDGLTPDELLRNADLALYRAKGDGRGTYHFFEAAMDAQMQERRVLENDLRKALPAGEFELHYQPVVDLESDRISGFEALLRWRHPEKGLIAPGAFIPVAEEIGFIVPLGEWVIRQACRTAAGWPGQVRVSVNLSPLQFRSANLTDTIVDALAASGLPADRLELEITETVLLSDSEATLSTLYQLRALGVRIAMDDFGTGYSSLSYLQSFPFDKIKIDRSFVKDIADGVGSLNIVRAVTAMAAGLGMATTAEGVETSEQLELVRTEGCTEIQGYVFSKPVPAGEVADLLARVGKGGAELAA
jgi:diguanylate cyclase (GGDEF)-like protein